MEKNRVKYWMAKGNWLTLVVLIPTSRLGELLSKIHDLIQESGLVESFHFRVGSNAVPLKNFNLSISKESDEIRIPLCYRILKKVGCSNDDIESNIGKNVHKLIGNEIFYSFNPKDGDSLKEFEGWLDPYESARQYCMSNHEWVLFIKNLSKFSDISTIIVKENFLSIEYRMNVAHLFHNILMMKFEVKSLIDFLTNEHVPLSGFV